VTETDGTRWAEHIASFHDIIALAGNSPWLVAMLTNLRELSSRYITHSVLAVPDRAQPTPSTRRSCAPSSHTIPGAADAVLRHLDGMLRALRTIRQLGAPAHAACWAGDQALA
jgi:DNA-binding FadR family transcriptional regulator